MTVLFSLWLKALCVMMNNHDIRQVDRSDTMVHIPVLGKTFWRRFWDAMVLGENHKVRMHPLPLLLVFGLAGILIDLDHFVIQQVQRVRPFHLEYFFCFWIVGICYYAYCHRCIHKSGIKWIRCNKIWNKKLR